MGNNYSSGINTNHYDDLIDQTYLMTEEYQTFTVSTPDDKLEKMLIDELDLDVSFWNKKPWDLKNVDKENLRYFLGDQSDNAPFAQSDNDFVDNRLLSSTRAILSYATAQLAQPDITPSRGDDVYIKGARDIQSALYQHATDNKVDQKVRTAVLNLLIRKRGPMKLRFDPDKGLYGDVITEVVNPEDIIIDRFAGFLDNPRKIYQRIRCTLGELLAKFPEKESDIKQVYSVKRGQYSQTSQFVTYYECWFTYLDEKNKSREGVAWFINDPGRLILGKQPNPNWVYTGDDKEDKRVNVLDRPPKPYVWPNYINTGHSYVDDTCLFEQARPLQEMLNNRTQQLSRNIDFMNGRWVASKHAFSEADAQKFVNKGARTVALVDADDVSKAIKAETPASLPAEVYNSVLDFRQEIDQVMGTPSQFKGSSPERQDTATRDLMVKQQAGMLQDDLVRCVSSAMEDYYKILLQMWRTYYTEDYWFQIKGGDGKYEFVLINGESLDSNVKISIQTDSTLPLDKAQIRATALELWKSGNAIDYRTLMEDLGLPNPEVRTERYMKSLLDPQGYLRAVEGSQIQDEAEVDIQILLNGKTPEERDMYDAEYINYFNQFLTTNRFAKQDQQTKQAVIQFLMAIQHLSTQNMNLQMLTLNDADMLSTPPAPPIGAAPTQGGMPSQGMNTPTGPTGAPLPPVS